MPRRSILCFPGEPPDARVEIGQTDGQIASQLTDALLDPLLDPPAAREILEPERDRPSFRSGAAGQSGLVARAAGDRVHREGRDGEDGLPRGVRGGRGCGLPPTARGERHADDDEDDSEGRRGSDE